ncbi:hypothetical protein [Indiicoccus explosivorum]|uniref:hypothetical protein n=1 Tax=Indiicoccus explosivorum TaxID=1917864 RepID=UPI000B453943|nr:hypothetical protein [Indiicoccus explosivorum]
MKKLEETEQVLLAYYAQYYLGASKEEIEALDSRLEKEIGEEKYGRIMRELEEKEYINGMSAVRQKHEEGTPVPMATNSGILAINTLFEITSDSAEESQLYYLENNLDTSGFEFTLDPAKRYVREAFKKEAETEPNRNRP